MIKLQHRNFKSINITVPGEVLKLDEKGQTETKNEDLAKALENTGNFKIIEEPKKETPKKPAPKKPAPKKATKAKETAEKE